MKRYIFCVATCAMILTGCGGGGITNGNSIVPSQTPTNLQTNKAQLAVGTARLPDGTTGFNVVTTFRQTNGLSATLVNSPSITGPAGFIVPSSSIGADGNGGPGTDAGTSSITSEPQVFPTPSAQDTFGTVGGVFSSGLAPLNNNTASNSAFYPGHPSGSVSPSWGLPFYTASVPYSGTLPAGVSSVPPQPYIIGPPAVPFFDDGTFPAGFAGYMSGFTAFEMAPVTGSYNLSIVVATANAGTSTFTASASLTNLTPLPALPAPTFSKDGNGGGTATVNVPADPRIVETLIYVEGVTSSGSLQNFYTSPPISGTGPLSFTLPDNLGPCTNFVLGCQNNPANSGKSLTSGNGYVVYAASFDYKAFESLPPGNTQQTPAIQSNGQADVSLSPVFVDTY